ncbi:MBL fold metallo-hydrolase [Desulfuribacillus alkaliarsenatis]|uniref:MBL fold metallo-hydrolase n=1 Tax=Desulfuribacillus alkaliarsenatis TaxID=766136 RepID=A0A1E5G0H1_9FIRM|nr:MBL fold metallo-hydrolase [Desulfuribacillus alkaliarsenatis]OEF96331.1 MBL fold metallo-hydrolase [Desulfuribacillus alkaliarsenatis]
MIIHKFPIGPVEANCYIVAKEKNSEGFIVDPGGLELNQIIQTIEEDNIKVTHILLTHGHFDHILGIDELRKHTGASVCIHEQDQNKLTEANDNLSTYMGAGYSFKPAEKILQDGEVIEVGNMQVKVLHTPGHTPGGVCYYIDNRLFSGDTLFAGSVGRTDFPGGSMRQLMTSIQEKLLELPKDTLVYPGHNEDTTIEHEMKHNPYISSRVF